MKLTLLLLSLLSTSAMAMTALPDGNYTGSGEWKDDTGATDKYTLQVQIQNNQIANLYSWSGTGKSFTMQAPLDQNGFFPVMVNGTEVGTGYCYSVQCHYSINTSEIGMEETLTFYQGHLYRTGSKSAGGKTVVWEEALDLVP